MKYSILLVGLLGCVASYANEPSMKQVAPQPTNITVVCPTGKCSQAPVPAVQKVGVVEDENTLSQNSNMRIDVVGEGVAPVNTSSPAQAYALAKRAAVADAYRLIAEKVKGVRIEGDDLIKNMMVKRSTVRTSVKAMVRNANVVETTFKDGLCEVEMEIVLSYSDFAQ